MARSRGRRRLLRHDVHRGVLLVVSLAMPLAGEADERVGGSIGAATDYLYRGVSQTSGEAAVQAGVQARLPHGFSIGAWGSSVDLNRDERVGVEVDLHATRVWPMGSHWSAALGLTHRAYFSDHTLIDYDRDELSASVTFQERITASIAWSPNTSMYWNGPVRGRATTYELNVQQPLSEHWLVFAGAGRYDLSDLARERYSYWSAGVTFTWSALQLDAAYIGSDESAEYLYGADLSGSRFTGALTVRF